MFCRNCGTIVKEDAAFCGNCGSAVVAAPDPEAAEHTAAMPVVEQSPETPPAFAQQQAGPDPFYAPAPVARASSTVVPIAIGAGVLVVLLVGGLVVWQTGLIGRILGRPKSATASSAASTTTSSTTDGSALGDQSAATSETEGSSTSALPDSESYDALTAEWDSMARLRADYGEVAPGEDLASATGWLYDTWSTSIGKKGASSARAQLRDDSKDWLDRFTTARDELAALDISSRYTSDRDSLVGIYDLLIARADIYYRTADYAVDNPSISKTNQPWRSVQKGSSGQDSTDALTALQGALASYTPPTAP